MTKFYIIRHGQTDYNKALKLQGRLDIPLNEAGMEQAKKMAENLADVNFDTIFYSPLIRAKRTADEIFKYHPASKYEEAPAIIERNFGDYEGKTGDVNPPYYGLWDRKLEQQAIRNGETIDDMEKRVFPFLDELTKKYQGKTICLVCHGGTGLIIREYFEGAPESGNMLDFTPIPNGEALIFEKEALEKIK